MLFALDEFNNRISPLKETQAFCPICKNKVIAVCGNINIPHWRHESISTCDSWKEHETEWHRMWKAKFPKEWQEYIIEKNGEKHIADIKTDNGLVLELQNSSISNQTIQIRENFYENMVWLINAEHFKDNFHIGSLVTENLKKIDIKYRPFLNRDFNVEDNLKDLKKTLSEYEIQLNSTKHDYRVVQSNIFDYENKLTAIESIANELLTEKYHFFNSIKNFRSEYVQNIKECTIKLNEIDKKKTNIINRINEINNFPNSKIRDYENYRIVPFERISSNNFKLCKVAKTKTINLLFPEVIEIHSESQFNWYSRQKNEFSLLVDFSNHLVKLGIEIDVLEKEKSEIIELKQNDFEKLLIEINNKLISIRDEEIKKSEEIEKSIKILEYNYEHANNEITRKREQLIENDREMKIKLAKDKIEEEYLTKRIFKGSYSYSWLHRRKSWDYAQCPLFLDFQNHIFEILSETEMKKITTEDFINKIKNWR